MKLNSLAEHYDLKNLRGYDEWAVDLRFRSGDSLFPWEVILTDPEDKPYVAKGGTPAEAYQNARFAAKI